MERVEFTARLRERLAIPIRTERAHPLPPDPGMVSAGYPDGSHGVDDFVSAAERHGVAVRRLSGTDDLAGMVGEIVSTYHVTTAVVSRDPEAERVATVLGAAGVDTLVWDGPGSAARADLGVTGAAFGIAATGSIVVDSARAGGRTASLLPPVHLALVAEDQMLATPADLWKHIPDRFPDGLPSQVVVITGPSKTGDIESVLTTGVHGPKAVWVGFTAWRHSGPTSRAPGCGRIGGG